MVDGPVRLSNEPIRVDGPIWLTSEPMMVDSPVRLSNESVRVDGPVWNSNEPVRVITYLPGTLYIILCSMLISVESFNVA